MIKDNSERISILEKRIKNECKGELGVIVPHRAFEFLNDIQREDNPDAYQPELVLQYQKRLLEKQLREQQEYDIDKTLFDFDDEIDKLSEVEERYKAFPEKQEVLKTEISNINLVETNKSSN